MIANPYSRTYRIGHKDCAFIRRPVTPAPLVGDGQDRMPIDNVDDAGVLLMVCGVAALVFMGIGVYAVAAWAWRVLI